MSIHVERSKSREAKFRHPETAWFDAPAANGAAIGRRS
jgi:hypothetical protein